ncbi:hypothetical protein ACEWY4_000994 [Coilia grayii]|uniref:Uncharacterized protein n=1 Tax=Coilia grayii TaxID=363190 RepID=A0ABD1KY81_9TELE
MTQSCVCLWNVRPSDQERPVDTAVSDTSTAIQSGIAVNVTQRNPEFWARIAAQSSHWPWKQADWIVSKEGEVSGTMSSRDPLYKEQIGTTSELDYRQYLQRLFGEATAEYFLSLSPLETDTPLWYTQMMDRLGDNVSAMAVWDALSDRTRALVMEMEANSHQYFFVISDFMYTYIHTPPQVLSSPFIQVKNREVESRKSLRHLSGVKLMFRHAKYHEACSALLLEQNPPFFLQDLEDSRPARFLRQEDATPEDGFKD